MWSQENTWVQSCLGNKAFSDRLCKSLTFSPLNHWTQNLCWLPPFLDSPLFYLWCPHHSAETAVSQRPLVRPGPLTGLIPRDQKCPCWLSPASGLLYWTEVPPVILAGFSLVWLSRLVCVRVSTFPPSVCRALMLPLASPVCHCCHPLLYSSLLSSFHTTLPPADLWSPGPQHLLPSVGPTYLH